MRAAAIVSVLLVVLLPAVAVSQEVDEGAVIQPLVGIDEASPTTHPTLVRTSDTSVLRVRRLVTLVQVAEGYLNIEQVWVLHALEGFIYVPPERDAAALRITLPAGAERLRVFQPVSGAQQTDGGILLRLTVGPDGSIGTEGADLLVQFSLPNESSTHRFEQTIPLPVESAFVLVPRETPYASYARLDVDLLVPVCEAGVTDDVVCFATLGGETPAWDPYAHLERNAAQGGTAAIHGARLVFETEGWPAPNRTFRWVALAGSLGALLFVLIIWRWQAPHRGEGSVGKRDVLEREKQRLLAELWRTSQLHQSGRLTASEKELQCLLLSRELEQVYDALGVEPDEPAEGGSAEEPASTSPQP